MAATPLVDRLREVVREAGVAGARLERERLMLTLRELAAALPDVTLDEVLEAGVLEPDAVPEPRAARA